MGARTSIERVCVLRNDQLHLHRVLRAQSAQQIGDYNDEIRQAPFHFLVGCSLAENTTQTP
jgi:hypothetical protein